MLPTDLDGKQQEPGEKERQSQSSASDAQPSADVAGLQKRIDELEKLYNGIKKSEDKINDRVEKRVSELTSQIGRIVDLAKAGKSESEIEERLLLDQILQERKGRQASSTESEGTEKGGQGRVDVQEIAKQLNLDMNDKDIAGAVDSGNLVNVMKVAMSKATAPSASVEDNAPLLGGGGSREKSVEAQLADYKKEMLAARGNKSLGKGIMEKYRKMGVPIERVIFSV